jgi:ubiquinone/menaquinone biosynthesis C-methylase UbiE
MSTPTFDAERFRFFEKAAHDRIADSYHAFFAPITEHAAEPLLDAAHVGRGTRVLDVAAGSGIVAAHARARGACVVGTDISPRMVSLAARLNPGCTFQEADVESMPFKEGSFDSVVCAFGVGHFPDPGAAVAECARVLAAGGWLALAWWDLPARNRLQGVLLEAIQEAGATAVQKLPPGPPMFRYSDDDELRNLLRSAVLDQVAVASHSFKYGIPDADTLWNGAMGSLARTSALLLGQPPETQRRIRSVFDRLMAGYVSGGRIELPMAFKVASGRRPQLNR